MFRLETRATPSTLMAWCSPLLAVLLTMVVAGTLFWSLGKNPLAGLNVFFLEPLRDLNGWAEVGVKLIPLLLLNAVETLMLIFAGLLFAVLLSAAGDATARATGMSRGLAIAALLSDLKARGLLEDTIVWWGSEFGRTPLGQGINGEGMKTAPGRDHHKDAYTTWLAGGGFKGGFSYGQTDELGFSVVENKVHVHDLQATILHLLGIDHLKLTYRFQGRDFRLTDVHGNLINKLLV